MSTSKTTSTIRTSTTKTTAPAKSSTPTAAALTQGSSSVGIGLIIGFFVFAALIAAMIFWCCRKKCGRRKKGQAPAPDAAQEYLAQGQGGYSYSREPPSPRTEQEEIRERVRMAQMGMH